MTGVKAVWILVIAAIGIAALVEWGPGLPEAKRWDDPQPQRPPSKLEKTKATKELTEDVLALIASAEEGSASAQFKLGRMYSIGEGVDEDHPEAAKWFRKAAEQGHLEAQNVLAYILERGPPRSPTAVGKRYEPPVKDVREALEWRAKAAQGGSADAQYWLAFKIDVNHVKGGEEESEYWYRKAAEQGHADAQDELSDRAEDDVQRYAWLMIAAANGSFSAKDTKENWGRFQWEKEMTPEQIEKGQELVRKMLKKNPNLLPDSERWRLWH